MEIVIKGRHVEISDRFREYVHERLARIEKFEQRQKVSRVEVCVSVDSHHRDRDSTTCVELTVRSKGPVVRAEACAADKSAALDKAITKLEAQLHRAVDRRRIHRGQHRPTSVAEATARIDPGLALAGTDTLVAEPEVATRREGSVEVMGDGPMVVREKTHAATPMSLDQALYEMELVGHDFYLFVETDTGRPSVVYRRCGYDYGVIHLV